MKALHKQNSNSPAKVLIRSGGDFLFHQLFLQKLLTKLTKFKNGDFQTEKPLIWFVLGDFIDLILSVELLTKN